MAKKVIKTGKGKKPITFNPGGLHDSTDTPKGQKIPASKLKAAASGKLGEKAKKQATLAKSLGKMKKK